MTYTNQVTIGPEFFRKAFNDYANWRWAIVREFMQNSIDCGSRRIAISVESEGGDTIMSVTNDGSPMSREILVTKLLALGGSGKNFNETVGGFGKAKEILYYAHKSYEIHTGNLLVRGSGAGYDLSEVDAIDGTRSTIVISGDNKSGILTAVDKFVDTAQWDGTIVVNGQERKAKFHKGTPRRDLGFGMVYTNRGRSNSMVVRINGTTMFTTYVDYAHCVLVELKGSSQDVLASNRDMLKYPYCNQMDEFIAELATNKRSALKNRAVTQYVHFAGNKLCAPAKEVAAFDVRAVALAPRECPHEMPSHESSTPVAEGETGLKPQGPSRVSMDDVVRSSLKEDFVLKNNTPYEVPDYYRPDNVSFSAYSKKLVKIWARLMMQVHKSFGSSASFSVGFIFDDTVVAERETSSSYGVVYYINPATVANGQFSKRFKLTSRGELIMCAVHEFCHESVRNHDEDFAARLTELAGKVLDDKQAFAWCFKG